MTNIQTRHVEFKGFSSRIEEFLPASGGKSRRFLKDLCGVDVFQSNETPIETLIVAQGLPHDWRFIYDNMPLTIKNGLFSGKTVHRDKDGVSFPKNPKPTFHNFARFGLTAKDWAEQIVRVYAVLQDHRDCGLITTDYISRDAIEPAARRLLLPKPDAAPTFDRTPSRLWWIDYDAPISPDLIGRPVTKSDMSDPAFLEQALRTILAEGVYGDLFKSAKLVVGVSSSHGYPVGKIKVKLRGIAMLDRPLTTYQRLVLSIGMALDKSPLRDANAIYSTPDVRIGPDHRREYVRVRDVYRDLRAFVSQGDGEMVRVPDWLADLSERDCLALIKQAAAAGTKVEVAVEKVVEEIDAQGNTVKRRKTVTETRTVKHAFHLVPDGDFDEAVEAMTGAPGTVHATNLVLVERGLREFGFDLEEGGEYVKKTLTERLKELQEEADASRAAELGVRIDDLSRLIGDSKQKIKAELAAMAKPSAPVLELAEASECMNAFFETALKAAALRAELWALAKRAAWIKGDGRSNVELAIRLAEAMEHVSDFPPLALIAPAGTGKSESYLVNLGYVLAKAQAYPSFRVGILVPTQELAKEIEDRGRRFGLDIGRYQGMAHLCEIWDRKEAAVQNVLAAKGALPCTVCPKKDECPYPAQDFSGHQIVLICGADTLTRPVPEKVRRKSRDLTLFDVFKPLLEGNEDAFGDAIIDKWAGNGPFDMKRGDFDFVIFDESMVHEWMIQSDDTKAYFRLSDLNDWSAKMPTPNVDGFALDEAQAKSLEDMRRMVGQVAGWLSDWCEHGVEAVTPKPSFGAGRIWRGMVGSYVKPKPEHLEAAVSQHSAGGRRKALRDALKAYATYDQRLDKLAALMAALTAGDVRLVGLRENHTGSIVVDSDPTAEKVAVQFNHRKPVHKSWSTAGLVLADATGEEVVWRNVLPDVEVLDLKVIDRARYYGMEGGPTHSVLIGQTPERDEALGRIAAFAEHRKGELGDGAKIGAVVPKVIAGSGELLSLYDVVGHLGNIRGKNTMEALDEVHVFGRLHPGTDTLAWRARTFFGICGEALEVPVKLAPAPVLVWKDGRIEHGMRKCYRHEDPRMQAMADAMIGSETVQAAGRLRGIRRGDEVAVYMACLGHSPRIVYQPELLDLSDYVQREGRFTAELIALRLEGQKFASRAAVARSLGLAEDAFDGRNRRRIEGLELADWIERHLIESRDRPLSSYLAEAVLNGVSVDDGKAMKAEVLRLLAADGKPAPGADGWKSAISRFRKGSLAA